MTITIKPTPTLTDVDGVPVRLWEGVTDKGVPCRVFVHRIAVHNSDDSTEFEKNLAEQTLKSRTIPLSMIL